MDADPACCALWPAPDCPDPCGAAARCGVVSPSEPPDELAPSEPPEVLEALEPEVPEALDALDPPEARLPLSTKPWMPWEASDPL